MISKSKNWKIENRRKTKNDYKRDRLIPESFVGWSEPTNVSEWCEEYEVEYGKAKRGARAHRNEDNQRGYNVKCQRERVD